MANPLGINQYSKIGGNRGRARTAQGTAKLRSASKKAFASVGRSILTAKTKTGGSASLGAAFKAASAGHKASSNTYRRKK